MTIILFLVDTSASMNQRTYLGTTLLDMTKGAVETFMKMRSRDPNSRWDRYMLLTFEDPPANVKAGWKESHTTFIRELKNLEASGLSTAGPAIKNTLDLLNINRMQSGIDTYGQGRCPFFLEPAIIICVTDGRKMTTPSGVQFGLNLPMNNVVPGSELTKEPFRWDQRLFGLVLRVPAVPPPNEAQQAFIPSAEDAAIDPMCDVTGGRSYAINSHRMLMQCLESLVQKCCSGVVINFEKIGPDPPPISEDAEKNGEDKSATQSTAWQNCRKLIYIQRSAQKGYFGHWPIPESFWPDLNSPALPPRAAHPVIRFSCTPVEPLVIENLAFDKYELEPSPLTQYILERRQPNVAWQVFVSNSAKYSDIGHAFGYLKASTNLGTVNLFVMPYNYPVLLPLLDDLLKVHKMKPTPKWRQLFENYLKTMPVYYAAPLRRALGRMQIQNLVPDQMDSCLSYSVVSYLKKLKNKAKEEYDRLVASVGQKVVGMNEGIKVTSRSQTSILQRKDFHQLLQHYGGDMSHLKQELTDFNTFKLALPDKDIKPQCYKNPFDISRKNLLDQLSRMRANFLHPTTYGSKLQDEENLHTIPVQDMGNYQEYLKRMPQPLREIETAPARQHTFGNPFKVNKNIMIDEADEAMPGQSPSRKRSSGDMPPSSPRPNKRKPGPLPKDVPARQLLSPTPDENPVSPPPTPTSPLSPKDNGPHIFSAQPPDYSDSYDLSNGEDLEIVMINQDSDPGDSDSNDDFYDKNNVHMNNHVNNVEVESPEITAIKEKNSLEYNSRLRKTLIKEIKKPGKNYEKFFSQLKMVQGSLDAKCLFLRSIIHEAARFKKQRLIDRLKEFEQTVVKSEQKKVNSTSNKSKSPSR